MKSIKKYLITIVVGFLMAGLVMYSKDIFNQTELSEILHILTDSFSIPAVLITGFGGLIFVSNEGVFDGLAYGVTSFIDMFRKEKKNQFRTFYDYKESKSEKNTPFGYLLICGLIFIVITAVFSLLYENNI